MRRDDDAPAEALLETIADSGLAPGGEQEDVDLSVHLERAPRAPLETWVRVIDGSRVVRALSADLSETGIRLAATARPVAPPGAEVALELKLPGTPPRTLRLAARAVPEANAAYGAVALAFAGVSEADREALRAYVGARSPASGAP